MMRHDFGDVVLVEFPQSGPSKKRKWRPALVILDIGDADIVLAPITTKERSGTGDYKIRDWSQCGLLKGSWVRLAKISCLEKTDIARPLGRLTGYDKDSVADIWRALYRFLSQE